MFKPTIKLQKKSNFVPTYHHCSVVGQIRPNCSLLRQEPKHVTISHFRNTDILKYVLVCHFCGISDSIRNNSHKLKFKYSVFLSTIYDHIPPATSSKKFFGMLMKNLRLLACERKFQDFCLSQKNFVSLQRHLVFHAFSSTNPKTCCVGEKRFSEVSVVYFVLDSILTIICGYVYFLFLVCFILVCSIISTKKKLKRQKYFILCLVFFFFEVYYMNSSLSPFT